MDKEKIAKLIRLANSNNVEHEANLAARKVCKILQEENWENMFNVQRQRNPFIPNPNKNYKPYARPNKVSDPIKDQQHYDPFGFTGKPKPSQQEDWTNTSNKTSDEIYQDLKDLMDRMYDRQYQQQSPESRSEQPPYRLRDWIYYPASKVYINKYTKRSISETEFELNKEVI